MIELTLAADGFARPAQASSPVHNQ